MAHPRALAEGALFRVGRWAVGWSVALGAGLALSAYGAFVDATAGRLPVFVGTAYRVASADVDGDGAVDLLLAGAGQCRLLRNDGHGVFAEATSANLPTDGATTLDAAFGDADSDGDPDLILANHRGRNRLLLNDGTGRFTDASAARLPDTAALTVALAVGDVDGDGDADLVVVCRGAACRLYINQAGSFVDQTASRLPGAAANHSSAALFDADGDGDLDLCVGVERGQCRLWRNSGIGVFSETTATDLPQAVGSTQHVAVADLDGDGDPDLVLAEDGAGLRLLLNDGSGHFGAASPGRVPGLNSSATQAIPADTDVDGDLDLVVVGLGQNALLLNDGSGYFSDATATLLPTDAERTFGAAAVDVDGDLDPDLVLARPQAQSRLWLNAMSAPRLRLGVTPTLVEVGQPAQIVVQAADEDGIASLEVTVNGVPVVLTDGTAQYVPAAPGAHMVLASARDGLGNLSAERRAGFTAVANRVPVVVAGPNASLLRGGTYAVSGSFSDSGPGPWTATVDYGDGGGSGPLALNPDKTFALSHLYSDYGTYTVTVAVADGVGVGTDAVLVAVLNQPPVLAPVPNQVVQDPIAFAPIILDAYVADVDHAAAEIAWSVSGNTVLQVSVDAGRVAHLTYAPGTRVTETLTFTATDPLGGSAATSANFTVAEPSADFLRPVVTLTALPPAAATGAAITLTLAVADASPITARELRVNGAPLVLDANGVALTTSAVAGVFLVEGTALDAAGNHGYAATEIRFQAPDDGTPPSAAISAPADLAEVTQATAVEGIATDANLLRYTLECAPVGGENYIAVASAATPVANGVLGTLDPSTFRNGLYTLRLTVEDRSGNRATASRRVQLGGQRKVGPVTLRYTDLHLPAAGVDIDIIRSYDSRNPRRGDFGIGWNLSFSDFDLDVSTPLFDSWEMSATGGAIATYSVQESAPHAVIVRFPNDSVEAFRMRLTPASNAFTPVWDMAVSFVPVRAGVTSALTLVGDNLVQAADGPGEVTLWSWGFGQLFNPERYRLTSRDGYVVTLHRSGALEQVRDPSGNTLTVSASGVAHSAGRSVLFTRDALGRITALTDPRGQQVHYEYDAYGDLVAVTDQVGRVTRYIYDRAHRLIDLVGPAGSHDLRIAYDAAGRLVGAASSRGAGTTLERDTEARWEEVRDALGNRTRIEYDDGGRITAATDPLGRTARATYDAAGRRLSETDPLGGTTTFAYDADGHLLAMTSANGDTFTATYDSRGQRLTATDPLGQTTLFAYDAAGRTTAITDPLGNTTGWAYDANGNIAAVIDPLGNRTAYHYSAAGDLTRIVDALGHEYTFAYDANGNNTAQSYRRTLADGSQATVTLALEYDARNRLVARTAADGASWRYEYGPDGHLERLLGPDGAAWAAVAESAADSVTASLFGTLTQTQVVDALGRPVRETDVQGRATEIDYDAAGQRLRVGYPTGAAVRYAYDQAGRVSTLTDVRGQSFALSHDGVGALTAVTRPDGQMERTAYDALLRPTTVTDALGRTRNAHYDAAGRLTALTHADGSAEAAAYSATGQLTRYTDARGAALEYAYDARGRLTTVTDAAGAVTTYAYDEVGNLTAVTDALGKTIRMEYDHCQRLTRRRLPLGMAESWTYDSTGRLSSHTDFAGQTTTFAYNALQRVESVTFADGSSAAFTYTPSGRLATHREATGLVSCAYDPADRLVERTTPDGSHLTYAYDPAGLVTAMVSSAGTTTYAYDVLGRLASVQAADGSVASYAYDAVGNVTAVTYPNGVVRTAAFDARNRPVRIEVRDAATTVLASFAYTYDANGNIATVTEADGREVHYTYDVNNRLTGEASSAPGGATRGVTYTYDAVGNRLTMTADGVTTTYAYDDNQRLVAAGAATWQYDANGNVVAYADGLGGETTYSRDVRGRLLAVVVQRGAERHSVRFEYHGGERLGMTVDDTAVTTFVADRSGPLAQVVQERDGVGGPLADYVRGLDLLRLGRGDQLAHCHADAGGSIRLLTDADGSVTDTFTYDAFGALLARTGATDLPYGFAGERRDPVSGLYDLRARSYEPLTGRFLERDPAAPDRQRPGTFNPYLYTENNPVNRVDPSGRDWNLASLQTTCAIVATVSAINGALIAADKHPFTWGAGYDGINEGGGTTGHHLKLDSFSGTWWQVGSAVSLGLGEVGVAFQLLISRPVFEPAANVALRHFTMDMSFSAFDFASDSFVPGLGQNASILGLGLALASASGSHDWKYSQKAMSMAYSAALAAAATSGFYSKNRSYGAGVSVGVGQTFNAKSSNNIDGISVGGALSAGVSDPALGFLSAGIGGGVMMSLNADARTWERDPWKIFGPTWSWTASASAGFAVDPTSTSRGASGSLTVNASMAFRWPRFEP